MTQVGQRTATVAPWSPARRELRAITTAARTVPAGIVETARPRTVWLQPPPVRHLKPQAPIVLVHGYCGNPATLNPLARRLAARGFSDIRTFGYPSYGTDVAGVAARLAAELSDSDLSATGVHLIGHSLGGLIVRFVLAEFELSSPVLTATTIATPNRGAPLAWLCPGALARDLRPGSVVLRHLARRGLNTSASWAAYYSDSDELVPAWSATLEATPTATVRNRLLSGHGHISIVGSRRLADDLVRRFAPTPTSSARAVIPAQRKAA